MGRVASIKEDLADFKRGYNEGLEDDSPVLFANAASRTLGSMLLGPVRAGLFGFLIAFDGVPLLPWGDGAAIAITIAAALASSILLIEQKKAQVVRFAGVVALCVLAMAVGDTSGSSILLVGAFVASASSLASNFPGLYALLIVGGVGAVLMQIFDWGVIGPKELPLSNRSWTPDRAGDEALHVIGFLMLMGLTQLMRKDGERYKQRATEAEAARDAAVLDERARIARELHDVVSHHVTAMTLQAEAAAITGDKQALTSVAGAGREALTELRRMLGVLRHAPGADPDGAEMEPQPDLAQLDRLAERTTAGIEVRVERRGDVRSLPAGVELCVYRLVQEALTNSSKHGDATAVDVVLSYAADMVTVEIRDNGKPFAAPRVRSGGLGLIGMQERVALLDGELATGPRSDASGYQVVARLPVAS